MMPDAAEPLDPFVAADVMNRLEEQEDHIAFLARSNYNVFCRYVFGAINAPIHRYIHDMAEEHPRFQCDVQVEIGKTTHCTLFRPIWKLGRNIYETIAIMSATDALPKRNLATIREHIERNPKLHRVFPELTLKEATKEMLTVDKGLSIQVNPSLIAVGIEGNILGKRWTGLCSDDMLRFQTIWTEHERAKLTERFFSEAYNRLTADAWHTDVGTPWHNADTRHQIRKMDEYYFLRMDGWTGEVFDKLGKLVHVFEGGLWPEYITDPQSGQRYGWPRERLEAKKRSMSKVPGGAANFDRQYRCLALAGSLEVFKRHDLESCKTLGAGREMVESTAFNDKVQINRLRYRPDDRLDIVVTGVDLAVSQKDKAHDTVMLTGYPDDGTKNIIDIRRGRMEGPEIIRSILDIASKYEGHRAFRVEGNGQQQYIHQFLDDSVIVRAVAESMGFSGDMVQRIMARINITVQHTTATTKTDPITGIRGLAVDFEQGRIPLPCSDELVCSPLIEQLFEAMLTFDPTQHPDDALMALWFMWAEMREFGYGTILNRFGFYVPK